MSWTEGLQKEWTQMQKQHTGELFTRISCHSKKKPRHSHRPWQICLSSKSTQRYTSIFMGNKQKGVFFISTYRICKADYFEPALFISMFGNVVCFFLSFIDTGLVFLAPIYISSCHEFMHSLYIPILRTLIVIDSLPINCGSAMSHTGSTAINTNVLSQRPTHESWNLLLRFDYFSDL